MGLPKEITELIERFERNREAYKSGQYNEMQLRQEFLDPFFGALGWDMNNQQGYAEAYKDVIHEDSIKVGADTKAPDYCFRTGGTRKFFLEAKKPSIDIKEAISPAFQLRRYAWSAKLPLSILSDFEEFAIYDTRIKPEKTDKASSARIHYFTYKDYEKNWDLIASVFSREAVLKGSFDKYAEKSRLKKGTATVDDAFLTEIEDWRDMLAKNIALRNADLSTRELNFAVQRTIDRIVFLRICEDRGIEEYGRLQMQLNGTNVYKRLVQLFGQADDRYNSGLFHFQREKERHEEPDKLTPNITIDDKPLKDIINRLYYPESPYEFSVLSADILGQVYEQFLGKVIRLTAGHQAKVEEKPEVRKAGGVYYTPKYIVDYIVKNTVGKLLNGSDEQTPLKSPLAKGGDSDENTADSQKSPLTKGRIRGVNALTPKEASKLRILDPACGSGSFLLGAYQYLLDWHRDWYVNDDPKKWCVAKNPPLYQAQGGDYHLTTSEKKRILLNNIYGVDIDSQAVEVTKLSLLLKVLEGENNQTLANQLRMFHERALPDLGDNIKCGNSLIGPDFYQQQTMLDDEERYRVNVFDWKKEFPTIFPSRPQGEGRGEGGFDAVIGNPPYVLLQDEFRNDEHLAYFRSHYKSASYKVDTYHLFIERSIAITKAGGRTSLITPANYLTNNYLTGLRRLMLDSSTIDHIVAIDGGVFHGISVDTAIFVVRCGTPTQNDFTLVRAKADDHCLSEVSKISVSPIHALSDEHVLFTGGTDKKSLDLWKHVFNKSTLLSSIADVNFGKQLRDRKKYTEDVISVDSLKKIKSSHRPCYTGRDVTRYSVTWGKLACLNDEIARSGGCWDIEKQDGINKLLTRQIGKYPEFALDKEGYHCLNTMFMVNLKTSEQISPKYLLGILNSRLMRKLWVDRYYDQRTTFPKIKGTYLKQLPIRSIDINNPIDKAEHDKICYLVDQMLSLNKRLPEAKTDHEKIALQRQIDANDQQIDQLVYELYDLTEEEIKIVEGKAGE